MTSNFSSQLFVNYFSSICENIVFRYWWLRIHCLAEQDMWSELEKLSKSKKSPIGYEVIFLYIKYILLLK